MSFDRQNAPADPVTTAINDRAPNPAAGSRRVTIPEVTHHRAKVNGTDLHYVRSGTEGTPVLLVHGFPESWWAFHKVIPRLAAYHQVVAVDLRGFGDSAHEETAHDSATLAEDLLALIDHLALGPVHLVGQDISSTVTFRAALDANRVRTYTAIEVGIPGYGLEPVMDVTSGGSWHFGFFAAPGIADMLVRGHEHEFLSSYAFGGFAAVEGAISDSDVDEFVRVYSQPDGFRATSALYASMLSDGPELRKLGQLPLKVPVLAVGAGSSGGFGDHTATALRRLSNDVRGVVVAESGHFVAMEVPDRLVDLLFEFFDEVEDRCDGATAPA